MRAHPCSQEPCLCLQSGLVYFLLHRKLSLSFSKMPRTCCAVGCTSRKIGEKKDVPFYKMPKGSTPIEKRRRQDWMTAIRRGIGNSGARRKYQMLSFAGSISFQVRFQVF